MIGDIIYNLFITPIEMVIEFIFSVIYKVLSNPGFAIIGVSLAINFLVLPLYKKSDALQDEERAKQAEMKPWLDHIKKHFKGDERYMMTQVYYRQVGYKPIYALRSSFSLLLQIPFFIAAYHYLSNLELLQGASFLCFSNLGAPDQLIPFFGGIKLNLLPILMTAINIISGAIYTRGFALKDKLQLYIIALVFLVLLYGSPAGLVFYWTLNNLFSLGKNFVMKVLPKREKKEAKTVKPIGRKYFILAAIFLTLFVGLLIPATVISSSPQEFIGVNQKPIYILLNTLSVFAGLFIVWFGVFYYLASDKGKNIFAIGLWALSGICVANFYLTGGDYGNISSLLVYDVSPYPGMKSILINLVVIAVVVAALVFLIKKLPKIVSAMQFILLLTVVALFVINFVGIQSSVSEVKTDKKSDKNIEAAFTFSKTGENVVVFMLDRSTGLFFEDAVSKRPELLEGLDGFTYYPNTVSYGIRTNYSSPSLFGGYEYTPQEINAREDESLKDKHNEAITVVPTIFRNNGFKVSCADIPYAGNYEWEPDMSIYDQEGMTGYVLEGTYTKKVFGSYLGLLDEKQNYNMVRYSIFRCMPQLMQRYFYSNGTYLATNNEAVPSKDFLDSYSELKMLKKLTQITEEGNNFTMMQNSTTHEPVELSTDSYDVTEEMPATSLNTYGGELNVHIASIQELEEWFDYLKEQGVYDNTRIIICGDHGTPAYDERYEYEETIGDLGSYNPLLLVKDFNAHGFTTSNKFMTLADVPTLAMSGVIEDTTNPATGNVINSDAKEGRVIVTSATESNTLTNNGNVFDMGDGAWYEVINKNIFDSKNFVEVTVN